MPTHGWPFNIGTLTVFRYNPLQTPRQVFVPGARRKAAVPFRSFSRSLFFGDEVRHAGPHRNRKCNILVWATIYEPLKARLALLIQRYDQNGFFFQTSQRVCNRRESLFEVLLVSRIELHSSVPSISAIARNPSHFSSNSQPSRSNGFEKGVPPSDDHSLTDFRNCFPKL